MKLHLENINTKVGKLVDQSVKWVTETQKLQLFLNLLLQWQL